MPEVLPWSVDNFKELLKSASKASEAKIDAKLHSRYFQDYFGHAEINARSIVVENDYVDRDYLEDYASYYVRCFQHYSQKCKRMHFFSITFTEEDLEKLIVGNQSTISESDLRDNYLGFIVIKPLPQTFIGRTCLRTYGHDQGRRRYPITRDYSVSLFGIPLYVKSLGFQEQDTVAGACATSALWSIFQGTGTTFHHAIPSPAEISNLADNMHASESRRSPSRGLTDDQAITAIRGVGLEPHVQQVSDKFAFQNSLYAYLRGGVPAYLGVRLCHISDQAVARGDFKDGEFNFYPNGGGHAVAVTGFSLGGKVEALAGGFLLRGTKIDKIYVHDDQVGPFAKMKLMESKYINVSGGQEPVILLETSWKSKKGYKLYAIPDKAIFPLYHKIRIPYTFVQEAIAVFDQAMRALPQVNTAGDLTWDIFLVTNSEYIDFQRKRQDVEADHRLTLATKSLPKYFWQASLFQDGKPIMTIFFDATDLEQGEVVVHIIEEDESFCSLARGVAADPRIKQLFELAPHWRIWDWFNRN